MCATLNDHSSKIVYYYMVKTINPQKQQGLLCKFSTAHLWEDHSDITPHISTAATTQEKMNTNVEI